MLVLYLGEFDDKVLLYMLCRTYPLFSIYQELLLGNICKCICLRQDRKLKVEIGFTWGIACSKGNNFIFPNSFLHPDCAVEGRVCVKLCDGYF